MKKHIGTLGLIMGICAVLVAAFQNDLKQQDPQPAPKAEESLKELAIEASKKLIKEKILNEQEAEEPAPTPVELTSPKDNIQRLYMALGLLAMIFGVFSWIQKDHIRVSGAAISLGLVAIAWQYVLIAVFVAIIIMLIANFSL